ncbi:MAG: hypothetical protein OIF40_08015 [Mangrovicoccus sp.]|nr:hypothetical protein [Mangrovicoccus sp.]
MGRIILHLGPEKCGSTSVQQALLEPDGPLHHLANTVLLNPYEVHALGQPDPSQDLLQKFHQIIETQKPDKPLILSHEMVFKSAPILRQLAQIARAHSDDVMAIAYCRKQSDFLVSSYGQWLFRSPDRLRETADLLQRQDLDPTLFWGIERHLIACILGGWEYGRQLSGHVFFHWEESAKAAHAALEPYGIKLSMGLLPIANAQPSLVEDFCQRSAFGPPAFPMIKAPRNPSFHPVLIEAIACAIEAGHQMPGPSDANNFMRESSAMDLGSKPDMPFLARLKTYVDCAFAPSNQRFAETYNLPQDYFSPREEISKDHIIAEICAEAARRAPLHAELNRDRAARAALAQAAWGWHQLCSQRNK